MPQELHVLRCYACKTFQVQIVKKVPKWQCKVCNEKQSVLKVFARGSGKDCRQYVQDLNMQQGLLASREPNIQNPESNELDEAPHPNLDSVNKLQSSKWKEYLDSEGSENMCGDQVSPEISEEDLSLHTTPSVSWKIDMNTNCKSRKASKWDEFLGDVSSDAACNDERNNPELPNSFTSRDAKRKSIDTENYSNGDYNEHYEKWQPQPNTDFNLSKKPCVGNASKGFDRRPLLKSSSAATAPSNRSANFSKWSQFVAPDEKPTFLTTNEDIQPHSYQKSPKSFSVKTLSFDCRKLSMEHVRQETSAPENPFHITDDDQLDGLLDF